MTEEKWTFVHVYKLFEKFGFDEAFERSAIMELLELKGSGASKFLSKLVQAILLKQYPVTGKENTNSKSNTLINQKLLCLYE